jgi:hypothetical protein
MAASAVATAAVTASATMLGVGRRNRENGGNKSNEENSTK